MRPRRLCRHDVRQRAMEALRLALVVAVVIVVMGVMVPVMMVPSWSRAARGPTTTTV